MSLAAWGNVSQGAASTQVKVVLMSEPSSLALLGVDLLAVGTAVLVLYRRKAKR